MIYALGDLHLDYTGEKSMEVFGEGWSNYQERIFTNWNKIVGEGDTVLIPGDISWAMDLNTALVDLEKIDKLNGSKILIRGNHDYWWSSLKKMEDLDLKTISFLQNNSFETEGYGICGTRGWIAKDSNDFTGHDLKIYTRELIRLENSLKASKNNMRIVMLHYPPLNADGSFNDFFDICKDYGVSKLIYGHLHGIGHKLIKEGNIEGVEVACVAGDYIDFKPIRIA